MNLGLADAILTWILNHPGLMITGFLIYCFVFALSVMFNIPKPGPNPFKRDCRKPPKPLVMDHKARDKVLKQGKNIQIDYTLHTSVILQRGMNK